MSLERIRQLNVQDMPCRSRAVFVLQGKHDLNAPVEISGHPVRGSHVEFFVAAVSEAEDACMLQESSDYRAHGDVLRYARNPDPEAADSAHNQLNLNARRGRLIELRNHVPVAERIHLGDDISLLSRFRMLNLTVNQAVQPVPEPDRGKGEPVPVPGLAVAGEHVEYGCRVLAERLIAGHNAAVRIEPRRGIVVVAGGQMHITADSVFLPANDKRDLAVGLQAYQAVNDMAAALFKHFRPLDIVLLVKSGLQFYQGRHLLPVLRRLRQRRDDRGMSGDAVEGNLDREHLRICRSHPDQIHNRIESFIGMMEENIFFADGREEILILLQIHQRRYRLGRPGFLLQMVEPFHPVSLHEEGQVQRTRDGIHFLLPDPELLLQDFEQPGIHAVLILKADNLAPLPLLDLFLDLFQKIVGIILVQSQVRVPRYPVRMCADYVESGKELVHIALDHVLQQDAGMRPVFLVGQDDDSGQDARNLDRGKNRTALERFVLCDFFRLELPVLLQILHDGLGNGVLGVVFLPGDQGADIERLVADQGKRPRRVHGHGRQYGIYIFLEITVRESSLVRSKILKISDDFQLVLLQGGNQGADQGGILPLDQLMALFLNQFQLLIGAEPGQIRL